MLFWPPSFSRIIVAQHFCKTQTHPFVVWNLVVAKEIATPMALLRSINVCLRSGPKLLASWRLTCHVEITGNGREMQIKATCVVAGSTSGVSWQREAIVVGKRWKLRLFRLTNVRSMLDVGTSQHSLIMAVSVNIVASLLFTFVWNSIHSSSGQCKVLYTSYHPEIPKWWKLRLFRLTNVSLCWTLVYLNICKAWLCLLTLLFSFEWNSICSSSNVYPIWFSLLFSLINSLTNSYWSPLFCLILSFCQLFHSILKKIDVLFLTR